MSVGQLGVLHTDSAYVGGQPALPSQTTDMQMLRLQLQIDVLKGKENEFAGRFGYSDVREMISDIRNILKGAPNDMHALQQFSSNNLRTHLNQFKNKYGKILDNQKIRLTLTTDKNTDQLNNILKASGGNGTISWSTSGQVQFDIIWNTSVVKHIINQVQSTHFQYQAQGKDNITALRQYLLDNVNAMITVGQGKNTKSMESFLIETKSSPFGLTKEQVSNLEATNRSLLVQLQDEIKVFIYTELCAGASNDFKRAVQTVMGQKISQLGDITFFMGGNGWITHAVGALGELQTAVLFQYIANKVPSPILATQITKLIGDDVNGYGQQLHTDLEIFNALGIQVKNYNSTVLSGGQERTVDVHLHPSEIAALGGSAGVTDYIINSYFNTSIPPYPEDALNNFFESYASELLNLDLNPEIADQVNFYMIGSNFIPGSVILEQAFSKKTINVATTISGQNGLNDTEYSEGDPPAFLPWWNGNMYIGWTPTGKNSTSAWNGKISITTHFTYSYFFITGDYSLF